MATYWEKERDYSAAKPGAVLEAEEEEGEEDWDDSCTNLAVVAREGMAGEAGVGIVGEEAEDAVHHTNLEVEVARLAVDNSGLVVPLGLLHTQEYLHPVLLQEGHHGKGRAVGDEAWGVEEGQHSQVACTCMVSQWQDWYPLVCTALEHEVQEASACNSLEEEDDGHKADLVG